MNIGALRIQLSVSERKGRGYRFFTVAELSARLSTLSCGPRGFFGANSIGAAIDDDDHWKKPFTKFLPGYAMEVRSSTSDRL